MRTLARVERLEASAGVVRERERAGKRRRLMELLAAGRLRRGGEAPADFAALKRAMRDRTEAELLRIVGASSGENFDAAVRDFARAYRRGEYAGLIPKG